MDERKQGRKKMEEKAHEEKCKYLRKKDHCCTGFI